MFDFMNALWNAEGAEITGYKNGIAFHGTIIEVRAAYGGDIKLTVDVDDGTFVIVSGLAAARGEDNLHVYF